jgi:UDP-glucuronate 4-epimerase
MYPGQAADANWLRVTGALVTGCAGFIGMHTCQRLLARGDNVIGLDNLNDYYDVRLKEDRLVQLRQFENFTFYKLDITDKQAMASVFESGEIEGVIHLAAQAGVRYSLKNPHAYIQSNLVGFTYILEECRHHQIKHLVFASSSSVYGSNTATPFSTNQNVDHPVSLYAATKKAGELIAHSYSHLYDLPVTCLRFFTVYGPWGRPDMSPYLFTSAILEGRTIDVFNHGKMQRDFTYVDDIVEGVVRVLDNPARPNENFDTAAPDPASSYAPYRVYNIGNHQPVELMKFIETIENALDRKAVKNMLPMQPGDVVATFAETRELREAIGFTPATPLHVGVRKFVDWYAKYHNTKEN